MLRAAHCQRCEDTEAELTYLRSELGLVENLMAAQQLHKRTGMSLREAKMILQLRAARHHAATRLQLLDNFDDDSSVQTIDVHVHRVRRALGCDAFEAIRGNGYCLTPAGLACINACLGLAQMDVAKHDDQDRQDDGGHGQDCPGRRLERQAT